MTILNTTIAALATAPHPAGVAVVRVSGPRSREIIQKFFVAESNPITQPRNLCFGAIITPETNQKIDQGLAVFFASPNSFTGEDVVEFQIHGSPLIAKQLLRELYETGIVPAEPGEFTKRAFLNGNG
jgi:tRNA modification GTPase